VLSSPAFDEEHYGTGNENYHKREEKRGKARSLLLEYARVGG
jgi:hypothetical protein